MNLKQMLVEMLNRKASDLHLRVGIRPHLRVNGTLEQISLLEELGATVSQTALCGLGKTAANPVLSTLRYFRDEYETHINEKKCPAGVCQALVTYKVDSEKCTCCGICKRACPYGAVVGKKKQVHAINLDLCQKCGICKSECDFEAIQVQ